MQGILLATAALEVALALYAWSKGQLGPRQARRNKM